MIEAAAADGRKAGGRRGRVGFRWDTWPRLRDPELVDGPGQLPFAWVATAVSTAIDGGFLVNAVGTEEDVRHLVLVVIAHGGPGIPVLDLMDGRMGPTDWPILSRQIGRTIQYLTATVADQSLVVSRWLPSSRRTIGISLPDKATVELATQGESVLADGRPVGLLDRPTMRIVPNGPFDGR